MKRLEWIWDARGREQAFVCINDDTTPLHCNSAGLGFAHTTLLTFLFLEIPVQTSTLLQTRPPRSQDPDAYIYTKFPPVVPCKRSENDTFTF